MPVKLRLVRMGKTKQPTYRVVASDSRSPRNGRFIELLGTYQPRLEPSGIKINSDKVLKWIEQGAQPTERVQKLLEIEGILTGEAAAKTQAAKKASRRSRPGKGTAAGDAAAATDAAASGDKPEGTPATGDVADEGRDPIADAAAESPVASEEKA